MRLDCADQVLGCFTKEMFGGFELSNFLPLLLLVDIGVSIVLKAPGQIKIHEFINN